MPASSSAQTLPSASLPGHSCPLAKALGKGVGFCNSKPFPQLGFSHSTTQPPAPSEHLASLLSLRQPHLSRASRHLEAIPCAIPMDGPPTRRAPPLGETKAALVAELGNFACIPLTPTTNRFSFCHPENNCLESPRASSAPSPSVGIVRFRH